MTKSMMAVCLTGYAAAMQFAAAEEMPGKIDFDFGGDIRARYEYKDNWPDKGKATAGSGYEDYLRFRTRLWGKMTAGEAFTTYIRIGNEFRNFRNSANDDKQKFPDELYLDNLYGEWKNDSFGVKIGRQDLEKGEGRVISDGTPGDGSRTTHFDAVVLTLNFAQKSSLDLIGIWNHYRDDLTVGSTEVGVYDMTKIKSGAPYSKMDEYGLIAYAEIREYEDLPMDAYWIWKAEEDFYSKDEKYPGRDFHTVGLCLTPAVTDWLSANIEAAYQFGRVDSADEVASRDISAGMVYAGLIAKPKDITWSPSMTVAMLYLSGDEDSYYKTTDGSTDTGWNPVFNRATWFSEIGAGMYDEGRWSNLIYPHVEVGVKPAKGHSVTVQAGPMYAAEKDNGATDDSKGFFAKAKYGFPLPTVAGIKLGGAVAGEMLDYGDYYEAAENTATWLRLEVTAKF